jgi:atypical dual specificity phosphatase
VNNLNFSWLIDHEVAGHAEPVNAGDLDWLRAQGVRSLVRMSEHPKLTAAQIKDQGMEDLHEPVADYTAPSQEQLNRMVEFTAKSVWEGRPVGVSCGAGLGRTGTVLACYLANRTLGARGIIQEIRRSRPGSVETPSQVKAVKDYVAAFHGSPA